MGKVVKQWSRIMIPAWIMRAAPRTPKKRKPLRSPQKNKISKFAAGLFLFGKSAENKCF